MGNKSTIVRSIQVAAPILSKLAPPIAARLLERLFLTPRRRPTPAREHEWAESSTIDWIETPHGRIPIYRWGDGPIALLVHGWEGRGTQLGAFVEPLRTQGFGVVAFDAPAHGRAGGRRSALPIIAMMVERVAAHIGPVSLIVGHSAGACAASIALSRGVSADRLVYLAPLEDPTSYLPKIAQYLGFSPPVAKRVQHRLEARFGMTFERLKGSVLAPEIARPLLIVHDESDGDVPISDGKRLARSWPGSEFLATQGLGHTRLLRNPAVIDAAVGFAGAARGDSDGVATLLCRGSAERCSA